MAYSISSADEHVDGAHENSSKGKIPPILWHLLISFLYSHDSSRSSEQS